MSDWIDNAATAILENLKDRKIGLDDVDEDILQEIKSEIAKTIREYVNAYH